MYHFSSKKTLKHIWMQKQTEMNIFGYIVYIIDISRQTNKTSNNFWGQWIFYGKALSIWNFQTISSEKKVNSSQISFHFQIHKELICFYERKQSMSIPKYLSSNQIKENNKIVNCVAQLYPNWTRITYIYTKTENYDAYIS